MARRRLRGLGALAAATAIATTALMFGSAQVARAPSQSRPIAAGAPSPSRPIATMPEGTSSTPGVFVLPQLGWFGFRCGTGVVQPVFDMHGVASEDEVTLRAGAVTARNFTVAVLGHTPHGPLRVIRDSPELELSLPFGHYSTVTLQVHQGTEARALAATAQAQFVLAHACYVAHWRESVRIAPF